MMLSAVLRAAREGLQPAGDVVLAVLADEEAGGDLGALHLVTERPDLLEGVRYAIGEFGGFIDRRRGPALLSDPGRREAGRAGMRATVRGPGGHGSMPMRGGAMAKLAELLRTLDRKRLPVHVTPVVERMVEAHRRRAAGAARRSCCAACSTRALTDRVLDVLGDRGRLFDPLLHNTVSPTIVRGGDKINVIPSEVSVELDAPAAARARRSDDLLRELRALAGDDVELEVGRAEPGPPEPDFGLFDLLAGVLRDADPTGTPDPAAARRRSPTRRHFGRLGIQGYGFTPMQLPPSCSFTELIHAADERIPADAVAFGADAMFRVLERYGS